MHCTCYGFADLGFGLILFELGVVGEFYGYRLAVESKCFNDGFGLGLKAKHVSSLFVLSFFGDKRFEGWFQAISQCRFDVLRVITFVDNCVSDGLSLLLA